MSREDLIEEIISNSKHLEEIEAARKDEERMIAEPEKHIGSTFIISQKCLHRPTKVSS